MNVSAPLTIQPRCGVTQTRRGMAIIELMVGIVVLMTALSIGLMAFNQAVANRRVVRLHDAAREAVALNVERLRALDAPALPRPGGSMELGLPPHLKSLLPGAVCTLTVTDGGAPNLIRARVELRCPNVKNTESAEALLRVGVETARAEAKP